MKMSTVEWTDIFTSNLKQHHPERLAALKNVVALTDWFMLPELLVAGYQDVLALSSASELNPVIVASTQPIYYCFPLSQEQRRALEQDFVPNSKLIIGQRNRNSHSDEKKKMKSPNGRSVSMSLALKGDCRFTAIVVIGAARLHQQFQFDSSDSKSWKYGRRLLRHVTHFFCCLAVDQPSESLKDCASDIEPLFGLGCNLLRFLLLLGIPNDGLAYYLDRLLKPTLLQLMQAMPDAWESVACQNFALFYRVASKFCSTSVELPDVIACCCMFRGGGARPAISGSFLQCIAFETSLPLDMAGHGFEKIVRFADSLGLSRVGRGQQSRSGEAQQSSLHLQVEKVKGWNVEPSLWQKFEYICLYSHVCLILTQNACQPDIAGQIEPWSRNLKGEIGSVASDLRRALRALSQEISIQITASAESLMAIVIDRLESFALRTASISDFKTGLDSDKDLKQLAEDCGHAASTNFACRQGLGASGVCVHHIQRNSVPVAVCIGRDFDDFELSLVEDLAKRSMKAVHPHVLRLRDCGVSKKLKLFSLVMEEGACLLQDIAHVLKQASMRVLWAMVANIARGIDYLHCLSIPLEAGSMLGLGKYPSTGDVPELRVYCTFGVLKVAHIWPFERHAPPSLKRLSSDWSKPEKPPVPVNDLKALGSLMKWLLSVSAGGNGHDKSRNDFLSLAEKLESSDTTILVSASQVYQLAERSACSSLELESLLTQTKLEEKEGVLLDQTATWNALRESVNETRVIRVHEVHKRSNLLSDFSHPAKGRFGNWMYWLDDCGRLLSEVAMTVFDLPDADVLPPGDTERTWRFQECDPWVRDGWKYSHHSVEQDLRNCTLSSTAAGRHYRTRAWQRYAFHVERTKAATIDDGVTKLLQATQNERTRDAVQALHMTFGAVAAQYGVLRMLPTASLLSQVLNQYHDSLGNILFAEAVSTLNDRGKSQDRFLVVTKQALYSFVDSTNWKLRRRIHLRYVESVRVVNSADDRNVVVKVPAETWDYHFLLHSRNEFVQAVVAGNPLTFVSCVSRGSIREGIQHRSE